MRDKCAAFKRFIFTSYHILCLTIARCLDPSCTVLARPWVARDGEDDTNVNVYRPLT